MRDGQGPITMWIGSNTDITEPKDLERQKEAFLSMITHELKTPLTALLGNVQITQRGLRRLQNLLDPEQTGDLPEQKVLLVDADRDRIGQVIQNYLSNALKYSGLDKPIHVGLTCESTTACVGVADQGPGLSEEMQRHIWEQFYRVPGIEAQSAGSVNLGVGLTICQGLIHRHQGQVGVESVRGEGSRFWFTLPLLQEEG